MAKAVGKTLRADGQRNRERIIAVAADLVGRDGAQVSLEEVAREAGVGSATLHRHFSSRYALLEAVYREGVDQLCDRAHAKPGEDPGAEMAAWLEELTVYAAKNRGLATSLLSGGLSAEEICSTDRLTKVLDVLVKRASSAGALRPGATAKDLMILANAISAANERDPVTAKRVLRLALAGTFSGEERRAAKR